MIKTVSKLIKQNPNFLKKLIDFRQMENKVIDHHIRENIEDEISSKPNKTFISPAEHGVVDTTIKEVTPSVKSVQANNKVPSSTTTLLNISSLAELRATKAQLIKEKKYIEEQILLSSHDLTTDIKDLLLKKVALPAGVAGIAALGIKAMSDWRENRISDSKSTAENKGILMSIISFMVPFILNYLQKDKPLTEASNENDSIHKTTY